MENTHRPVLELRVALTAAEYERLLDFYTVGLGLEPAEIWTDGPSRAVLLEMGHGTLELFNEAQADMVDGLEVGRRVSGPVRFALQVPDVEAAVERLVAWGAALVHPPVLTPWGDTNARVQSPDGMQITLFQHLGDENRQEDA
ncbi:MAG TPA: VOC family protein [Anaerolineaceae bacterium]|nr:VOC family protein [Anaerolineaceae bacterium]